MSSLGSERHDVPNPPSQPNFPTGPATSTRRVTIDKRWPLEMALEAHGAPRSPRPRHALIMWPGRCAGDIGHIPLPGAASDADRLPDATEVLVDVGDQAAGDELFDGHRRRVRETIALFAI
jgi:hypothetical protein